MKINKYAIIFPLAVFTFVSLILILILFCPAVLVIGVAAFIITIITFALAMIGQALGEELETKKEKK